jgi:hypothetical protein
MKQIFKKISAIAASALMMGMTMGVAAAATYPSPFVVGSDSDVAIVYGSGVGVSSLDQTNAALIYGDLAARLGTGTGGAGGSVSGGDSVLLAKASDKLNINNTWGGVYTGTITSDNLKTLLVDGTYVASDNDEFDYEQKIAIGFPELKQFRDSDYEALIGLTERTPVVGFRLTANQYVMNYTVDFLTDVTSDVTSGLRMEDIEGSDLKLMGKTYYVSELNNGTATASFGKMILLDSANTGSVKEGETVTVSGHEVSIDWIDSAHVSFNIDGVLAPSSGTLHVGDSTKLSDGSYLGVKSIKSKDVSGTVGSATFSIGTGKLEINHGSDIKMNDDTVSGVKAYVYKSTAKLDKIVIEWRTQDESFLTPGHELLMPGFGAVKFSMNNLIRNTEEKVILEKDGDTSIKMTVPIRSGTVDFNLLWANASGDFAGIGKSSTEQMATTNSTNLTYYYRFGGEQLYDYFFATYNNSKEGESYKLQARIKEQTGNNRNVTDIYKDTDEGWVKVCSDKSAATTCDIGSISLYIQEVNYTNGGNQSAIIRYVGTDGVVSFHHIITEGGLTIYLPFRYNVTLGSNIQDGDENAVACLQPGYMNFTNTSTAGHSADSAYIFMDGENKDGTLGAGTGFNFTLDRTGTTDSYKLHVVSVNHAGSGGGSAYGAEEVGDSSGVYQIYVKDDVAPRVVHYTKPNEDWAEVYYPTGESETYAEVFLTEAGAVLVPGAGGASQLGEILVLDTQVSTVSSKNLIVVGGSCINSVAANLVGGAYCGSAWTEKTGVGTGQFLIKSYTGKYTAGKIALLVAGYEYADTTVATTALKTKVIDTSKEYTGTTSTTTVTEVTATA